MAPSRVCRFQVESLEQGCRNADASALRDDLRSATQLRDWQLEGEAAMANNDGALAKSFFASALTLTGARRAALGLVKADLSLGLCDAALRTTRDAIKRDADCIEAYVLRAQARAHSLFNLG
eukprot:6212445-Pleurochrysis_carterae.AAC.1